MGADTTVQDLIDITDRKGPAALRDTEARQAFLLRLSDALRPLTDAASVQTAAMALLAEHLGVMRASYFEIEDDGDTFHLTGRFERDAAPMPERMRLSDFSSALGDAYRSGRTLMVSDTRLIGDFVPDPDAYAAIGVGAWAAVPLLREGQLVAWIGVHSSAPRTWADADLQALDDVAERTGGAVERTRAEAALRDSEKRFANLFESSPAPILVLKPDAPHFTIAGVNGAYLAATMSQREGLLGLGVFEAFPGNPDDPEDDGSQKLRASLERVLATGRPDPMGPIKYDVARPDGAFEERWWSPINSPMVSDDGGIEAIIHNANDVTERVVTERALAESQQALKALNDTLEQRIAEATAALVLHQNIVQSNPGPILAFDRELRVTAFNQPHADKFFETQGAPSFVGQRFPDYFIPEEQPQITALMERALAGETFTTRVHFGDPARKKLFWDLTHGPLRDADGAIVGGFHHAIEVTAQVEAERALAQSQEALRHAQKMEAMGQLTGGVAHDFNNLLTPILGALDLLQRRGVGDDREQRLIGAALQSADRAKTLVQRLLAFARRQPLQPVPADLTQLVAGMRDLIASTVGPQIELSIAAPESLPAALVDINQIEMALLNLSVNARDAMPSGGRLQIAISEEKVKPGHRSKLPEGRYIRLAVIDTGIGMDEQTLERAVEPFFSTKGVGQGTGLGLSMAHGVARQLNGALTLRSAVGHGAEVELWLPLSDTPVAPEKGTGVEGVAPRRAGTVLLVDDEELVRLSTAEMLTDLGFAVVEVGSALEALQHLDRGLKPTVIVSDHLMPGMTGAELAVRLRERSDAPPVLIVSGYAESEGIAADLPRLVKPFRQPELNTMLSEVLAPR